MSEDEDTQRRLWLEAKEADRRAWHKEWSDWIEKREKTIDQEAKEDRAYTNLIVGAGYAAYFGLWHLVGLKLNETAMAISGLCILVSGGIFVSFEIYKALRQGLIYARNSKIANSELTLKEKNKKYDEVCESLQGGFHETWFIHFVLCALLSAVGVSILAWNFIMILIQQL